MSAHLGECIGRQPSVAPCGWIAAAQPLYTALRNFHTWLKKQECDGQRRVVCVGQNVPFDIAWLKNDFHATGLDTDSFRRCLETATLGFLAFGECMGLAKIADKLGINNQMAHDALGDAYTASKVFHRLRERLRLT